MNFTLSRLVSRTTSRGPTISRRARPRRILAARALLLTAAFAVASIGGIRQPPSAFAAIDIVGGEEADPGEWPWQAGLFTPAEDEPDCGASLIAPGWVLTAAHCVEKENENGFIRAGQVEVGLGLTDLRRDRGQRLKVAQIIPHPNYYGSERLDGDLALLRLVTPAQLGPKVQIVSLADATDTDLVEPGDRATVTGWGETGSGPSPVLKEVEVGFTQPRFCESGGDILCATGEKADACYGDSGGPLVAKDGSGWTQVGIVSFGTGDDCATRGNYGGYADVAYYIDWIRAQADLDETVNPPAPDPDPEPLPSPIPPSPEPGPGPGPGPGPEPSPEPEPVPAECEGRIVGRVTNWHGRRLEGAEVLLMDEDGGPLDLVESNDRGRYRFDGLCAGSYLLQAEWYHPGFDEWLIGDYDADEDGWADLVDLDTNEDRAGRIHIWLWPW